MDTKEKIDLAEESIYSWLIPRVKMTIPKKMSLIVRISFSSSESSEDGSEFSKSLNWVHQKIYQTTAFFGHNLAAARLRSNSSYEDFVWFSVELFALHVEMLVHHNILLVQPCKEDFDRCLCGNFRQISLTFENLVRQSPRPFSCRYILFRHLLVVLSMLVFLCLSSKRVLRSSGRQLLTKRLFNLLGIYQARAG